MNDNYIRKVLQIVRVIDGDTFEALIDLGFGCARKLQFRIAFIDTPEISKACCQTERSLGQAAKETAIALLTDTSKEITILSSKDKSFDRYIAEIFIDGAPFAYIMAKHGHRKLEQYEDAEGVHNSRYYHAWREEEIDKYISQYETSSSTQDFIATRVLK